MRKGITLAISLFLLLFFVPGLAAQDWQTVEQPEKIFQTGFIQVTGISAGGQSRYRAMRAATVVAQRNLLEIIQGINLSGSTTVKNGMLHSDEIKTKVSGILKGATKCGKRYYSNEGYAKICMKVYLKGKNGVYNSLLPVLEDSNLVSQEPQDYQKQVQTTSQSTQPQESQEVPQHDGLIVDVRDYNFKPALINRIMSSQKNILFEPSMVASDILVERGCGGFTNTSDKAKALLSSWGSKDPMLTKAQGLVKNTDVKLDSSTATQIEQSNAQSNFLAEAKVVFVLD